MPLLIETVIPIFIQTKFEDFIMIINIFLVYSLRHLLYVKITFSPKRYTIYCFPMRQSLVVRFLLLGVYSCYVCSGGEESSTFFLIWAYSLYCLVVMPLAICHKVVFPLQSCLNSYSM